LADLVSEESQSLTPGKPTPAVSRHRFGLAYMALAAIVGASVGLIVVFATRHDSGHGTTKARSAGGLRQTGTLGAREIAARVTANYRLPDGRQFVAATANKMEIPTPDGPVAIGALLVSTGRAGVARERYTVRYPGNGVLYQLCGGGQNCLPAGRGSALEDPLLYRESVDLALNTFHYLPVADNVLIFLPSQRGVTQSDPRFRRAILFGRKDLAGQLAVPLARTIPPVRDVTTGKLSVSEAGRFEDLTTDHLFHYDVQQSVNNLLIQLTPPAS
jgi:hypothetical protein